MPHVPFEQRQREVVYIMEPPRRRTNGWGIAGFTLVLLSCGILSPLALIFSFLGLFRRPRGLATAGFLMSLIGTGIMGASFVTSVEREYRARENYANRHNRQATEQRIKDAKLAVEEFRSNHNGQAPDGIDGNKLVLVIDDGWRQGLAYELDDSGYTIRSAGPDGEFQTLDDVTSRVLFREKQRTTLDVALEMEASESAGKTRPPRPYRPDSQVN